jgi:lipopolysaccharide export system protein LptA
MKKIVAAVSLCTLISVGAAFAAEESSKTELQAKEALVLKADSITYEAQSRSIVLKGAATVQSGTTTLYGDKIVITQGKGESIIFSGNVRFRNDDTTVKAAPVPFEPSDENK